MIGGELGLWKALDGAGPLTSAEIAERSGVAERYVREWASAQAASGYLEYDPGADTFTLPAEQAMTFANEDSPVFLLGGYHVVSSAFKDRDKIAERFRNGTGFGWHEHDPELFLGTEQFFRPGYMVIPGHWPTPYGAAKVLSLPASEEAQDSLAIRCASRTPVR